MIREIVVIIHRAIYNINYPGPIDVPPWLDLGYLILLNMLLVCFFVFIIFSIVKEPKDLGMSGYWDDRKMNKYVQQKLEEEKENETRL